MSKPSINEEAQPNRPRVRVRVEREDAAPSEYAYTDTFRIGRGEQCELHIPSGMVSRVHAEVVYEDGAWWMRDLGSTNGLYVEGRKLGHVQLEDQLSIQLGHNAPTLYISLEAMDGRVEPASRRSDRAEKASPAAARAKTIRQPVPPLMEPVEESPTPRPAVPPPSGSSGSPPSGSTGASPADASLSHIIERYFDDDPSRPAGEHTMMIRQAYASVKKKEKRKYTWVVAGVGILLLAAIGIGIFQFIMDGRREKQAALLFAQMKQQDLQIAKLRNVLLDAQGDDEDVSQLLQTIQEQRRQQAALYDGFVKELGLYRKLSDDERLIYQTARIFNESEFEIPAGFVREVRRYIREHWQGPGRRTYEISVRRAQQEGFVPIIVEAMQRYGLPPEFFYLALQESRFEHDIVGIWTRWGIAKGMWQFIPDTGQRYGLRIGPRADTRVYDPQDERHDVEKATDAAARYLLDIYSTPAQASGLLVMASYNWGEHRVISKLARMTNSAEAIEAAFNAIAFEGIPQNPDDRNYWRFLTEYEERMPEETKDYVLKIFSAAVIGQDPRRFGFDFDNPLTPDMETPAVQTN